MAAMQPGGRERTMATVLLNVPHSVGNWSELILALTESRVGSLHG